jgi:hypothetical protein
VKRSNNLKAYILLCIAALLAGSMSLVTLAQPTPSSASPTDAEDLRFRKAFLVANACDAAYLSGSDATRTLNAMGVERFKFLDFPSANQLSDTQILLASLEGYTLICFRGTQELVDWKTNLSVSGQDLPFGPFGPPIRVHSGFYKAWIEAKPGIAKYLDEVGATRDNNKASINTGKCHEILIGGHSLGGALATISSVDLVRDGYQVLGTFTFGQPKVFSSEMNKIIKSYPEMTPEIERFVFKSDPVPLLPPGYEHIGNERYSDEIGNILKMPRAGLFWPSVGDHSMKNYVKTLAALISTRSKSPETLAMVRWLSDRNTPLTSYLNIPSKEAEIVTIGFTDTRERVRCRNKK